MILSFRTHKLYQTVQTQIRLLLEELSESDQSLHCFVIPSALCAHFFVVKPLYSHAPSVCLPFSKISETALPIKAKFYVEPPWVGGTKVCSRHLGHMTKMATTPINGKNPSQIFFSPEPKSHCHQTWHVAWGTRAHHSLFKL